MNDPETIPGQLEDLRDSVNKRFMEGHDRMGAIEATQAATNAVLSKMNGKLDTMADKLDENTAITNIVKDGLTTARVGRTVLVWAASIAAALGGLWGALQAFAHK